MITVVTEGTCVAMAGDNLDRAAERELNDRLYAAWTNTWGRCPGTTANRATLRSSDLAAAAAVLVWEATLPPAAAELVWHGDLGLDGKVRSGVVSNGVRAVPVHHLRDVPAAVAQLGGEP